jgi:hypothetical protein
MTPLRWIGVGITGLLVITVLLLVQQTRTSLARGRLQEALDRGEAFFQERDFIAAAREYGVAAEALQTLGRTDADAMAVLRKADEVAVLGRPQETPLTDLLKTWLGGKPAGGDLAVMAGEGWLVLDTHIAPILERGSDGRYTIDLPLQVGRKSVDVVMEPPPWKGYLSAATAQTPQRVILAVQVAQGELPSVNEPVATVVIQGSTAILWTDPGTYAELGLIPAEEAARVELEAVLEQQRRYLEDQP